MEVVAKTLTHVRIFRRGSICEHTRKKPKKMNSEEINSKVDVCDDSAQPDRKRNRSASQIVTIIYLEINNFCFL